jgi:hypothetical protein
MSTAAATDTPILVPAADMPPPRAGLLRRLFTEPGAAIAAVMAIAFVLAASICSARMCRAATWWCAASTASG